ncbi:hypothetical protein P0L94_09740 [Microbacter sp. GSS18]|nr:hypothetical protein P0L94_09740 [Microbacter sp. GSS18]
MDSTTFTAYRLDHHRAAQLDRENAIIRAQRERASSAEPYTHSGVIARVLRFVAPRRLHRVASAH